MGDQKAQRRDLSTQAGEAARKFLEAFHDLVAMAERRPYLGNFADSDFTGTNLSFLDAATIGTLFDFVVPSLQSAYADALNSGRNKQILNQVAPTL